MFTINQELIIFCEWGNDVLSVFLVFIYFHFFLHDVF